MKGVGVWASRAKYGASIIVQRERNHSSVPTACAPLTATWIFARVLAKSESLKSQKIHVREPRTSKNLCACRARWRETKRPARHTEGTAVRRRLLEEKLAGQLKIASQLELHPISFLKSMGVRSTYRAVGSS